MSQKNNLDTTELSVADRVLSTFVETVAEEQDLTDIAARLKEVLLGGAAITEPSLRKALFGEVDL